MSHLIQHATAARPERTFSWCGLLSAAKRGNMKPEHFQWQVFIRRNQEFVPTVEELVVALLQEQATKRRKRKAPAATNAEVAQAAEVNTTDLSQVIIPYCHHHHRVGGHRSCSCCPECYRYRRDGVIRHYDIDCFVTCRTAERARVRPKSRSGNSNFYGAGCFSRLRAW